MTAGAGIAAAATRCEECATEVAAGMLACPVCRRLVHGSRLKELTGEAAAAAAAGDVGGELVAWRAALDLLPAQSRQYAAISEKVSALTQRVDAQAIPDAAALPRSGAWKWVAGLGSTGLLLWKFKFILVALLTKGKFLVLGLTKASTFFSMALAFGVYWTAWGMWFALGLVVSIYVHEMGHVAALRRYGIAATAPMFVPGLGAFIRLRQAPLTPREDARVGLAGPIWGLGAALAAWGVSRMGGGPMWAAIAHTGAWLNLFNLLPVWQLDGNRGFAALTAPHRWIVTAAFGTAWLVTGDGLLVLLLLAAGVRSLDRRAPDMPDRGALAQFVCLVFALAILFRLNQP
jgi:Zn-dependent protease